MELENPGRRKFIKYAVIGGVSIYFAPLVLGNNQSLAAPKEQPPVEPWAGKSNHVNYRIDGITKVTGQKVYARDFYARDMDGWPNKQHYGYILRATDAQHIFTGINLDKDLGKDIYPYKVITAQDLKAHNITAPHYTVSPRFYGELLLPAGNTPKFLGQPVAVLLFDKYETFMFAKEKLQFSQKVISYGKFTGPVQRTPYGSWRVIRVQGKNPKKHDVYSRMYDGPFFPKYNKNEQPVWPKPDKYGIRGDPTKGMYYAEQISDEVKNDDWHLVEEEYSTQIVDCMALEPENGNCWFDTTTQTMHTVVDSQSPIEVAVDGLGMVKHSNMGSGIKNIVIHTPYIGGGFGSKDHAIIPFYAIMASLFSDKPVRIANDRYEQFQAGIKRHPFKIKNKLAINKKSGKFEALISDMSLDGGGRQNYSSSVAELATVSIQSIYYLPRNDLQATAYASRNVDAGTMRGVAAVQVMPTMEMMIEQAAKELNMDSMELRLKNAMQTGQRNTQGAVPTGTPRYTEMIKLAKKNPIWIKKEKNKQEYEASNPNYYFGTGFGIVTRDYGTGADTALTKLSISHEGRVSLAIQAVEMGTGVQTSQAMNTLPYLGKAADEVTLADTDSWAPLALTTTAVVNEVDKRYNPYMLTPQQQDSGAKDPRWVPVISSSSSSSNSAYFFGHGTTQTASLLFKLGLWPAALSIWGETSVDDQVAQKTEPQALSNLEKKPAGKHSKPKIEDATWVDGKLTVEGLEPISTERLAKRAHEIGAVTSLITHAFSRWQWAEADFVISGKKHHVPLDALAVQYGAGASSQKKQAMTSGGYELILRRDVKYPSFVLNAAGVETYAPAACLVEIAIHKSNGSVKILKTHQYLDSGPQIVPQLVSGQQQGGIAMGIGQVLHEYLPSFEEGPGNGTWNLNRYQVPLARDVSVWNQAYEVLPPLKGEKPKGIAEVSMIPVIAAVVNAAYHATGHYFRDLPLTPDKIKGALP